MTAKDEVRVLTPIGMLGYGIPLEGLRQGIAAAPDVITVDSGSTDSGPQKLALGSMTCSREAYVKDLSLLLDACHEMKIPVHISSAGGDGSNGHVDAFVAMIREISAYKGYRFNLAAIYADIGKDHVRRKLREGRIAPCGPVPHLDEAEVRAATTIVGQMGAEPFLKAMEEMPDLDIIIAGRAYDPAPTAAAGLREGIDPGLSWHMGKIMECGAQCAEPGGRSILGFLGRGSFELEPVNLAERCTVSSVAAHTLYEKSHPFLLPGPGGTLDLSECVYEQITERRVRVSGSRFLPTPTYKVKLEGAKPIGYRAIFVGGNRDPLFIDVIDETIVRARQKVAQFFSDVPPESYQILFHLYGKNGVMGELEPIKDHRPLELCIICEVAAPSQQLALAICGAMRVELLHIAYPGKIATAGNLGFPFTPLEIPLGEVCAFNIYHLMDVESPTELFPTRYFRI